MIRIASGEFSLVLSLFTLMLIISVAPAQVLTPNANPPGIAWAQWALNPQHTLFDSNVTGQPINNILASIVYDHNVAAEKADPNAQGTLLVHYQVPMIDGNDVF